MTTMTTSMMIMIRLEIPAVIPTPKMREGLSLVGLVSLVSVVVVVVATPSGVVVIGGLRPIRKRKSTARFKCLRYY